MFQFPADWSQIKLGQRYLKLFLPKTKPIPDHTIFAWKACSTSGSKYSGSAFNHKNNLGAGTPLPCIESLITASMNEDSVDSLDTLRLTFNDSLSHNFPLDIVKIDHRSCLIFMYIHVCTSDLTASISKKCKKLKNASWIDCICASYICLPLNCIDHIGSISTISRREKWVQKAVC